MRGGAHGGWGRGGADGRLSGAGRQAAGGGSAGGQARQLTAGGEADLRCIDVTRGKCSIAQPFPVPRILTLTRTLSCDLPCLDVGHLRVVPRLRRHLRRDVHYN